MSYHGEPTEVELNAWRDPLETNAAMNIGLLVFAYSRLELSLERYLESVPADGGTPVSRQLPWRRLVHAVDAMTDASLQERFRHWIARAQRIDFLGTALGAGRWIPDRRRNCIVLDVGVEAPTAQVRVSDLAAWLALVRQLQAELQQLCASARGISVADAGAFLSTQPIEPQPGPAAP